MINNNKNKKQIPIFFATDDNYIPYLAVTLESLIANASKNNNYLIKVLYTNVSDENIAKIKKYNSSYVDIDFVNVSECVASLDAKLHLNCNNYTKTTYYRMFIPELFPQFKKALYLDCDIILRNDVSKLYNINIFNNLVGASPDDFVRLTTRIHKYMLKGLGLRSVKHYFNAGVLIMNLAQLRKQNFQEQFEELIQKYNFIVQDQDYLNVICKNKVWYIPNTWNRMPVDKYDGNPKKINLVHFNLRWKPWKFDGISFEEDFWKYAKRTEYYDSIKSFKENYTIEKQENEIKNIDSFMDLIAQDGENPNNYYHLYVEPEEDNGAGAFVNKLAVSGASK